MKGFFIDTGKWLVDLWKHGPLQLILSIGGGWTLAWLTIAVILERGMGRVGCKGAITVGDALDAGLCGILAGLIVAIICPFIIWWIQEWFRELFKGNISVVPSREEFESGLRETAVVSGVVIALGAGITLVIIITSILGGYLASWIYC